jgi:hypothetical protein
LYGGNKTGTGKKNKPFFSHDVVVVQVEGIKIKGSTGKSGAKYTGGQYV